MHVLHLNCFFKQTCNLSCYSEGFHYLLILKEKQTPFFETGFYCFIVQFHEMLSKSKWYTKASPKLRAKGCPVKITINVNGSSQNHLTNQNRDNKYVRTFVLTA